MRGSEPVMWAHRPQIGRVSGGARAVRRRRAEQAHFRHPTPQRRKRALTEEEEGGASDDEPWSDLLMHSRRSRTLWLKLACELDADVLIPGAPHATSLYTSSKAEQACMWAWWANAWSSNCAYSVTLACGTFSENPAENLFKTKVCLAFLKISVHIIQA